MILYFVSGIVEDCGWNVLVCGHDGAICMCLGISMKPVDEN